jgi:hypothetical protein
MGIKLAQIEEKGKGEGCKGARAEGGESGAEREFATSTFDLAAYTLHGFAFSDSVEAAKTV